MGRSRTSEKTNILHIIKAVFFTLDCDIIMEMTELETQVVKIQLGDNRQSTTFVYTLAETIDSMGTEIYVICELPMFNPAAKDECQRIAEAITASLKRTYRKTAQTGIFESSLASINEELSKLVTLGKTHWLGKLNAAVAVKHSGMLSVSSVGKISALIYRDGKFSPVTDTSIGSNQPLKTFEQFSEGKLRLGDLFMLSTPELLNHISIDRIKTLLDKNDLPIAAQSIIEYLNEDMGPDVSCGTIFALQVEAGTTTEEEVDLGQYLAGPIAKSKVITGNSKNGAKGWVPHKVRQAAATSMIISKNFLKDFRTKYIKKSYWQGVASKSGKGINLVQGTLKKTAAKFQPNQISGQISGYSRQKKFFFIAAAILLVAFLANVVIAKMNTKKTETVSQSTSILNDIEKDLNDADAMLVYGDEAQAVKLYTEASELFKKLPTDIDKSDQAGKFSELKKQAEELGHKLNKEEKVTATSLGTLGNGSNLINLPDYFAVEVNRTIVAYQKSAKQILDNKLKSSEPIIDSVSLASNMAAIYNGSELFVWDYQKDLVTGRFSDRVPSSENFGGIKTYSTNNKVYVLDKAKGEVRNFTTANRTFTAGNVSATDDQFKDGSDLAIDGNIYVASNGTILKYNSGKKVDFSLGVSGLSDSTKLFTQNDFTNLYILDSGNKRLIIVNKTGALVRTMTSDQFTELKDFAVDEKGKAVYILNGSELLQVKI